MLRFEARLRARGAWMWSGSFPEPDWDEARREPSQRAALRPRFAELWPLCREYCHHCHTLPLSLPGQPAPCPASRGQLMPPRACPVSRHSWPQRKDCDSIIKQSSIYREWVKVHFKIYLFSPQTPVLVECLLSVWCKLCCERGLALSSAVYVSSLCPRPLPPSPATVTLSRAFCFEQQQRNWEERGRQCHPLLASVILLDLLTPQWHLSDSDHLCVIPCVL